MSFRVSRDDPPRDFKSSLGTLSPKHPWAKDAWIRSSGLQRSLMTCWPYLSTSSSSVSCRRLRQQTDRSKNNWNSVATMATLCVGFHVCRLILKPIYSSIKMMTLNHENVEILPTLKHSLFLVIILWRIRWILDYISVLPSKLPAMSPLQSKYEGQILHLMN